MNARLARLNGLSPAEAEAELRKCCGSTNWARRMAAQRPFPEMQSLFEAADRAWHELGRDDWLEAFSHHPRIGERHAARAVSPEAQRWSEQEQAGTRSSSPQTLDALAEANLAYEARFGYTFIVCATGKSTEEMLAIVRARLANDSAKEMGVAAEEQRRITRLRLEKLVNP